MNKTTLPTGMHDKLFKRARASYEIERTMSDLLIGRGFNRVETPTIEHFEVFSDHVASDQYICFGADGALLTLRPDVTSQIGASLIRHRSSHRLSFLIRERYLDAMRICVGLKMKARRQELSLWAMRRA